MNNIIIPVVDKEMLEFAENMKKRKDDFVIIGATVSLEKELKKTKKANVVTKIFEDGSKKEEIINSLKEEMEEGKVIVCRKPLSDEEIDKFFASEEDVIICKETRSKFHNFFFKLWQIFMQMLFGFEFRETDLPTGLSTVEILLESGIHVANSGLQRSGINFLQPRFFGFHLWQ